MALSPKAQFDAMMDKITALQTSQVTPVYGEVPTAVTGRTTFQLSKTPITGTVRVYVAGLRVTSGFGLVGGVLTFTVALLLSQTIVVDYDYKPS